VKPKIGKTQMFSVFNFFFFWGGGGGGGGGGRIRTLLEIESRWIFVLFLKFDTTVIRAFSANYYWYLTERLRWTTARVGNIRQTWKSLNYRLHSLILRNTIKLILNPVRCSLHVHQTHTNTHTHTHKQGNGKDTACNTLFLPSHKLYLRIKTKQSTYTVRTSFTTRQ